MTLGRASNASPVRSRQKRRRASSSVVPVLLAISPITSGISSMLPCFHAPVLLFLQPPSPVSALPTPTTAQPLQEVGPAANAPAPRHPVFCALLVPPCHYYRDGWDSARQPLRRDQRTAQQQRVRRRGI